jgi:hypothetical protein
LLISVERFFHGDACEFEPSNVDDTLDTMLSKGILNQSRVEEGSLNQRNIRWDEGSNTGGEVIKDDNRQGGLLQFSHHMRADISGTAGY